MLNPVKILDAATSTGTGTVARVPDNNISAIAVIEVSGTGTGLAITPQALFGGTRYTVQVTKLEDGSAVASITANGLYRIDVSGFEGVSVNVTAITGGAVTVQVRTVIG